MKEKGMVMMRVFLTGVLILLRYNLLGQPVSPISHRTVDSLVNLLNSSAFNEQVDIYNLLAAGYAPYHFDSSIMFSAQATRIATVYGYPKGIGIARFNTGNAYYYKMSFKNALLSYLAALKIFEENNLKKETGDVYLQLGNINFFIRQADKSFSYYRAALENYQEAGDEASCVLVYEAMSLSMNNLNYSPIDSSLRYANLLLKHARKVHDPYREAMALLIIGQIYTVPESEGLVQRAIAYDDSALMIANNHGFDDLISVLHLNLGVAHDLIPHRQDNPSTGDFSLDLQHFRLALRAQKRWGNTNMAALIYLDMALEYIDHAKFNMAEKYLDSCKMSQNIYFKSGWRSDLNARIGYAFSKIIDYFLAHRTRVDMLGARFMLARDQGNYQQALEYFNLYRTALDTMNASSQGRQLELLMAEAEAEKTDQRIRMLSQENELNQLRLSRTRYILIGVAGGLVIISLFMMLFIQRKKWKSDQRSFNLEQKLLRSQMNPHFIFNSLASIQNFIVNQKAYEASIYLSRFSQLVRNILDSSVDEFVPIRKEIETIRNYLDLQQVRYAGKFEYNLHVDDRIDEDNMLIPPMLAQPFIENSIEHGIKYKETTGHINISFRLEGDLIRFEVEDDGVGREKSREIELKQNRIHRSMSTSITYERLIKLNKKLKHKIRMEIIDLKDNLGNACGTKVTFGIPVVVK